MRSEFYVIGYVLMLSSCIGYTNYSVERPPQIVLADSSIHSLVIINRFDTAKLEFDKKGKNEVFSEASGLLYDLLKKDFEENFSVKPMELDTLMSGELFFYEPVAMSKELVAKICREKQSDYVIALESFDSQFDQDVEVVKNEDGSKSRTAYYDLVVTAGIALYDKNGNIIYNEPISERTFYDKRSVISGLLAVGPSMRKAGDTMNELVHEINKVFMAKFRSSEEMRMLSYYKGKPFKSVANYIDHGKWEKAIEELLLLSDSENSKTKGKACYNLSVCYQALGNAERAEYWYNEARPHLGNGLISAFDHQ